VEEKEKIITVIDKRHFTKDGTRRNEVWNQDEKGGKENSPLEEKAGNLTKEEIKSDSSFGELVMFIVHNALAALGRLHGVPSPGEVNLEAAGTMIEWLEAVQRKCKGNLSKEEEKILRNSIYELKMLFIEARQGKR